MLVSGTFPASLDGVCASVYTFLDTADACRDNEDLIEKLYAHMNRKR